MKIAIDISEEDYRKVQDGRASVAMMRDAIKNGKVLPKGHGRLIDANALDKDFSKCTCKGDCSFLICPVYSQKTIIEADAEESEIQCNRTDEEIAKSFIEDVEAVKDFLLKAESEGSHERF